MTPFAGPLPAPPRTTGEAHVIKTLLARQREVRHGDPARAGDRRQTPPGSVTQGGPQFRKISTFSLAIGPRAVILLPSPCGSSPPSQEGGNGVDGRTRAWGRLVRPGRARARLPMSV